MQSVLFDILLEVLASARKTDRRHMVGKKELPLFTDGMIIYTDSSMGIH